MVLESARGPGTGGGTASANATLREASLPDLAGRPQQLSQWLNRTLVCNFWATWCAPCREEIPLLMAARRKYGPARVEIVGIAVDNANKVRDFSASLSISYPVLLAEAGGIDLMRKLGNGAGGLPYTVVTDRQGNVVQRRLGALKEGELDGILDPLTKA